MLSAGEERQSRGAQRDSSHLQSPGVGGVGGPEGAGFLFHTQHESSGCLIAKPASCSRAQTGGCARTHDRCAPCTEFKTLHTWVNLQLPMGHRRRLRIVRQSLVGSERGWKPVGSKPFSNQRTDTGRWHLWVNWWQIPDHTWRRGTGSDP